MPEGVDEQVVSGVAGANLGSGVILILGLITVATLLVATLTAAVKSRTDQIS